MSDLLQEEVEVLVRSAIRRRVEGTFEEKVEKATYGIMRFCQSPIERRMACELIGLQLGGGIVTGCYNPEMSWAEIRSGDAVPFGVCIWFQASVGKYVSDFIISYKSAEDTRFVSIECDGHEFHERTKEQATHDRKRDRIFQAEGLPVFRFTGREIVNDAARCAREIEEFLGSPRVVRT